MPELIAQGKNSDHRWRRLLPLGETVIIGRASPSFRVPWDDRISREHISLRLDDNGLRVQRLPNASNPVFFLGRESDHFTMQSGEHFVIGTTTFTLTKEAAHASLDVPNPVHQKTYSSEFLRNLRFRNAEKRIEVLNRLPDIISSATNEQDLINRISNMLLIGIPGATTVGFVNCPLDWDNERVSQSTGAGKPGESASAGKDPAIQILHWDRRVGQTGDFRPSERLIRQAISTGQTVLHQWKLAERQKVDFTFDLENDWAFVCPMEGPATAGWGIYVAGSQRSIAARMSPDSDAEDLQGDIKFCQLLGAVLSNLFQIKRLERRQASLRSFFSPIVMDALGERDPDEVLAPQECQVSVMFCDLRGFSQKSEDLRANLFQLLRHVSRSLDVMTGEILKHGGVIGDFHGDAAMGFWGWPLHQSDTAKRAIEAAIAIEARFREMKFREMGFQIAIGIASGTAVVGKIGSQDQVKVTAFGPVVNRASRLEGMNRVLNCSMLIDRATYDLLPLSHDYLILENGQTASFQCFGKFQPYGMGSEFEVFQILPEPQSLTSAERDLFRQAIEAFQSGDWDACLEILQRLPANDAGRKFLENFIRKQNGLLPSDWSGVVKLASK
jgi:adenylate cyclase